MPRTIRYHLDENVAHAVAFELRRQGIDVTTTSDAGLIGAPDSDHLAFALAHERVIFTHDHDFLVAAAAGSVHAGLVYCHTKSRSFGQIIGAIELIWDVYERDEMQNRVEFI